MAATITAIQKRQGMGESAGQTSSGETEQVAFTVTVTEANATPMEVVRATFSGLPAYNSTHSINTTLKVINKTATRVADKAQNKWIVTCTYGVPTVTATGGGGIPTDTANSFNVSVRVYGQETCLLTNYTNEATPKPIYNSVGDPYPDPVEIYVYDEIIQIDYEATTLNINLVADLRGCINNAPVTMSLPQGTKTWTRTFPKHTLLLRDIPYAVGFSKSDPTNAVWQASPQLIYRADTWDKYLPQKGYRWYATAGVGASITAYKDHAENLAANGTKLGAGLALVPTAAIQVYPEANLSAYLTTI